MGIRLEHPEALAEFERAPGGRVRGWALAFLVLWLLLVGGDWVGRFYLFRCQDQWWPVPAASTPIRKGEAPHQTITIPAQTGAGLTHMVPAPWIAARHAEHHPEYVEYRDGWGYANAPAAEDTYYPVVMTGDSFMLSLGTQNVAQVLAGLGGIPVYNHALPGSGPLLEIQRFIMSGRVGAPAQVVGWDLIGRELGAPLFLRQPVEAWFAQIDVWAKDREDAARFYVRLKKLLPSELRKDWPNTSVLAYFCRHAWGLIELAVFRDWPRDVMGVEDPQFGPMLFYRENLRVLPFLTAEENAPGVVKTVARISRGLRERGVTLVIMLVPEKEQIHVRALPPAEQMTLADGPALLAAIASGLEQEGVPVVNLMPVFQQVTAAGQRLYWRDDTHWNDAGIRLAAEELWRVVEPLLK